MVQEDSQSRNDPRSRRLTAHTLLANAISCDSSVPKRQTDIEIASLSIARFDSLVELVDAVKSRLALARLNGDTSLVTPDAAAKANYPYNWRNWRGYSTTQSLGKGMAKEIRKAKPKAIDLSAQQLVSLLIEEAGESKSSIAKLTDIDLSAISRFHSGQRKANESDFRKLATLAISLKIAE